MSFSHVTTWIFDLDNTLYPPEMQLFPQIERRMTLFVMRELDVDEDEASKLRTQYWREHGTTLAGLMRLHGIQPTPYLRDVHDVDFSHLKSDPELAAAITALPGRKIIHTNGDSLYAQRVLNHRGLDIFDAIFGVEETGYHPKPDQQAYDLVISQQGFDPATAAMFEDDPRNLLIPDRMGMRTILVGSGKHGPDLIEFDPDHGKHVQFHTNDLTGFLQTIADH